MRLLTIGLVFCFLSVGCRSKGRLDNDLKIAVPQKWNAGVGSTNSVTGQWWLQFDDPKLGALVHEALSNNFDLRVAAKRLELAQVQARMADYSSRPKFAASVNGEKRQSNYIGMPFGGNEVIKSRTESFASNLSVNWELDLWARIRHAQDAVELEVYAVNLDNEAAAHSIISQVVKGWFSLGEANQLTKLMEQQLELAQLAQKQVEIRFMLGRATASELKRAQANLAYEPTVKFYCPIFKSP